MRSVIMKGLAVCALFVLTVFSASAQSAGDDPVADPKAVVVSGNTRFTVLESRLVRMEWAADGKFEDGPPSVWSTENCLFRFTQ